jgi:hypothetical protein
MPVSAPRMNGEMREEELELRELLRKSTGFDQYAAEKMPEFIQVVRDYEGFVRDIITVTEVTPEDLVRLNEEVYVVYSKDIDATAVMIARGGEAPSLFIKGTTVKVTFFPVTTPRLTITQWDLDTEPYDLMRRTQEKAGQSLAKLEDTYFLSAAEALVVAKPSQAVTQTEATVQKAGLLSIKKVFSTNNVAFAGYLMNPATYDDFLAWGENELDPWSQRSVLETGQLPTLWGGIKITTGIIIAANKIYGLSPKEILGRMPILRDITIDVQRIPETQDKEILAYEYIGMYIHDARCIVRLTMG